MCDFDYYIEEFGGCCFEESEEFGEYVDAAIEYVGKVTRGNADYEDDDIKNCICALAEVYLQVSGKGGFDECKLEEKLKHTAAIYLPPLLTGEM
ncbi:MAG: hypothetical protein PUB42_03335 [Firmicutes bacterium]|nr:hypothetical protein [Bacillota bacterium]